MDERISKRTSARGLVRSFYEMLRNRRRFDRAAMSGRIFLTPKNSVVETTHMCECVDASLHGLGIECPEPVVVDRFVELYAEDSGPRRLARVRYCIERGDRYRVGLEFIAEPQ